MNRTERRRGMVALVAMASLLWPAAQAAPAKTVVVQGVVTQIVDGSSVRFTPPGQPAFVVRLRDIEAPEPCQPGAAESKAALSALALNKSATLQPAGRDRQGRTWGALTVDDVNVGRRMVEDGHAWSVRTRNDIGPYVKQERMAKALGRGLHAQPGTMSPRDWRRTKGACT
jgi:endonuclease YncB( thermonuclease family)